MFVLLRQGWRKSKALTVTRNAPKKFQMLSKPYKYIVYNFYYKSYSFKPLVQPLHSKPRDITPTSSLRAHRRQLLEGLSCLYNHIAEPLFV
ncbi:hypothetical protein HZ326_27099 [Fusarium oxysporum f. sp. albedinis]|nr:hypothetical protein HZ326_27099 [Fusarium oxysporum f. sp. albedinis]